MEKRGSGESTDPPPDTKRINFVWSTDKSCSEEESVLEQEAFLEKYH